MDDTVLWMLVYLAWIPVFSGLGYLATVAGLDWLARRRSRA